MKNDAILLEKWETQLRKGTLELMILAALAGKERYGFELIAEFRDRAGFDLPEGTIYPLLTRLAKDGLVETDWRERQAGAPRKYYRPSPLGHRMLAAMTARWRELAQGVDLMMEEVK